MTPGATKSAARPNLPPLPRERALEQEAVRRVEAWLVRDRRRRSVTAPAGRVEAVEEAGGGSFRYSYDSRGDLCRIVESGGRSTTFEYDEDRRLSRVVHPDGSSTGYAYEGDHLVRVEDRGVTRNFEYDDAGRLARIRHGKAGASVYRYDGLGRVVEARTASVSTRQRFHPDGRVAAVRQTYRGVPLELRLEYDDAGRLAEVRLPGGGPPIRYSWDEKGRPRDVALGERALARFYYLEGRGRTRVRLANGVIEDSDADPVDRRPVSWRVLRGARPLLERAYAYDPEGRPAGDGARLYEYDALDRLTAVEEPRTGRKWRYRYDALDNRVEAEGPGGRRAYNHDADGRLLGTGDGRCRISYDALGRPVGRDDPDGNWTYRYDDAGRLLEARRRGETVARFTYDHKGRLVAVRSISRSERYLYGPDDQLFAVTDEHGAPLRLYAWTPLGLLAEVRGSTGDGAVRFHHQDHNGTRHLLTGEDGRILSRLDYDPFGVPSGTAEGYLPMFGGRTWYPEVGMYHFGARWYDPRLGRFLTPDTYTGRPDDERFMHPCLPAGSQSRARSLILADWLKHPRVRNRYAFCGNDPVGRIDPNGHWSFGWTLLSVLGAIWTLPNTLVGLFLEITCLVGEVLRWLAWVVSFGNVTWESLEPPGFDVAASGRLNAFALVFKGGWLGSIPGLWGITFGNVFFVHGEWDQQSEWSGTDPVYPSAYKGKVSIPRNISLYEHELRHTNQYGWFGPFFHLGLPVFGVYLWDVIVHGGYSNAWTERDARAHSEDAGTVVTPAPVPSPGGPAPPAPPPGVRLALAGKTVHKTSRDPVPGARVDVYGTQLRLPKELRSFEKPDTASKVIGSLRAGDYGVLEIVRNVKEADYALARSDTLPNGQGWICIRTKESHYALLYDKLEKEGAATTDARGGYDIELSEKRLYRLRFVLKDFFDAESARLVPPRGKIEVEMEPAPDSVKESYLIDRIKDFKDFNYVSKMGGDPKYPYQLDKSFSVHQAPPRVNDCCSFVEALSVKAWKDARGDKFTWDLEKHKRMMIGEKRSDPNDWYSPVTEVVASGMGIEVKDTEKLPPPWTVVQGWRKKDKKKECEADNLKGGHTFFVVAVHEDTGRVLTLESTATQRENEEVTTEFVEMHGPGFRKLGDIDDFKAKGFNPGKDWWKDEGLWTWKMIKADRPCIKMARLKVYDATWVR